jgi:hypothetical protein
MKATVLATAAAMVGVSAAASHGHRHLHRALFEKKDTEAVCTPGCTTIYSTITGEPTRMCDPTAEGRVGDGSRFQGC